MVTPAENLADRLWAADSLPAIRAILKAAGLDPAGPAPEGQAATGRPPYHVPGPYEIALTLGAALASTGRYETPGAALAAGWFAVPEFFAARDEYLTKMVPAIYGGLSPQEGAQREPESVS